MYYVIWWLQLSGATLTNYPSFYLTHNKRWRPHTINWLSSRLLKQKCSHGKLGQRWLSPRAYFSAAKTTRSRKTPKKEPSMKLCMQAYFVEKIKAHNANLPPSNLPSWRRSFFGESAKVDGQGKGENKKGSKTAWSQVSLLLKPMS